MCVTLNMSISEHVRWAISACCQAAALFMAVAPAAPAAVAFCSSSMSTKGSVNVCTNTSCRKVCLVCSLESRVVLKFNLLLYRHL